MYQSIAHIKAANAAAGYYFFSPDTMRFFRSKVASSTVYGGRYFITSEQFVGSDRVAEPRRYTIRVCNDDGSIDTVGGFQAYATLKSAKDDMRSWVLPVTDDGRDTLTLLCSGVTA